MRRKMYFLGAPALDADRLRTVLAWYQACCSHFEVALHPELQQQLGLGHGASEDWARGVDLVLSFGGDGTMLQAVQTLLGSNVPILGVNLGRLGFLSNASAQEREAILRQLVEQTYTVQDRDLLELRRSDSDQSHFALNEVTMQKRDSSSMIAIDVWVNNNWLNTYWADGIIVATPTGSTAYSLSCAGPLISPDAQVLCITPMAAHNLTVRPMVLPLQNLLHLQVRGRIQQYMLSIDNQTFFLPADVSLTVQPSAVKARFVVLEGEHFFSTLRAKLHWGLDKRTE